MPPYYAYTHGIFCEMSWVFNFAIGVELDYGTVRKLNGTPPPPRYIQIIHLVVRRLGIIVAWYISSPFFIMTDHQTLLPTWKQRVK